MNAEISQPRAAHTPTPEDVDQHVEPHMVTETLPTKRRQIDIVRKFKEEGLFRFGCILIAIALLLAIFSWLDHFGIFRLWPYDPNRATGHVSVEPPGLHEWPGLLWATIFEGAPPPHWFGTDNAGLDVFSRTLAAPRTDMTIALVAAMLSMVIGTTLGLIAGFYRNIATETLMRISDLLQAFPVFITAMVLVALSGRNEFNIILALALVYTPIFVRLTRAEVMGQAVRGYVESARAVGNPNWRVAFWHVLPNSLVPSLVQVSTTVGFAILLTSGLSFVGAGVRPPTPEWGLMIALGADHIILGEWWMSIFPGLAISITVFGFAAVGHGLEEDYR